MRYGYRAGKLDIVLSDSLLVGQMPRKRRTCSLVWVAEPSLDLSAREPVPLVLFRHPCEWRVRTVQALDCVGRRWRAAFESGSLIAIQAAVRAGVGIATLLPGNVETGMSVLDPRTSRLPVPPRVELAMYRRPTLRTDSVSDFLESLLWKATG
jgi:DNA-binding transcriptional LysR family regulator